MKMYSNLVLLPLSVLFFASSPVSSQAPLPGHPLGECEADSEQQGNFTRLCQQCSRWRRLPPNYKPPMLQEVLCDAQGSCLNGQGNCRQRYAKIVVVIQRNGRNREETLQVPEGCECRAVALKSNVKLSSDDQPSLPHCNQVQHADGSLDLCSTCVSDVLIDNHYLPSSFQQVTCGNSKCLGGRGSCRPYTINMNLLQKVGDQLLDVQRQVTVGCECWTHRPGSRLLAVLKRQTLK